MNKSYVRSKIRITHCIEEGNIVSVRYSHYVKTIENPREEMLLAHFFVIWEIKDGQIISRLSNESIFIKLYI
jgi:predicted SnoaL-like aldol condensation-catalyzing enzyme